MARLVPALAGSALVFAPYFFREKIKPQPALILAFLFAIDPGLVALSRQANGTILAVTFLLFAWGMWWNQRLIPAGIFAGLALLAGPSVWTGDARPWTDLAISAGHAQKPTDSDEVKVADEPPASDAQAADSQSTISQPARFQLANVEYRPAIFALIVTLLFGGTLFFLSPNGLSAWLSALPAYLKGWVISILHDPRAHVTAFICATNRWGFFLPSFRSSAGYRTKSRRIGRLSMWLGVALLLAVFYRQTSELVWAIIPLLTLAAMELRAGTSISSRRNVWKWGWLYWR